MKQIIITLTLSLSILRVLAQSGSVPITKSDEWARNQQSKLDVAELEQRITDKRYLSFLEFFYSMPLPFNYSRAYNNCNRSAPLSGSLGDGRDFRIYDDGLMRNYLAYTDKDFYYKEMDRDIGEYKNRKLMIYADQSYFLNQNYIVIQYSTFSYTSMPYDNVKEYLCVLNNAGELISRQIVKGDSLGMYNYQSYVIIDKNHFATYYYTPNEINVEKKNDWDLLIKYKDDSAPHSKCIIVNYTISDNGKITQSRIEKPILLKEDCWKYTSLNIKLIEDDPILKY